MARRRKNSGGSACIYVPQINMEPSEMYVGLLNKEVSRPLTNYIYAKYLTSDAADKMDALGYKRNDQGQHSAKDVYEYFKVGSMVNEQGYSLNKLENKYNVIDSSGERKLLSSREAYRIAREVNANEKSFVAQVVQRGDNFTVIIDKLDGRTAVNRSYVEGATLAWQALENGFRNLGLSLDTLENTVPDLVNPGRVLNFLDYVGRLSRADVESLNERDILILLNTGNNGHLVQNLLNRGWGTLQETAAKAYDVLVNPSNYAPDTVNFVKNALTQAKTINSNVFRNLRNEIKDNVLTPFYENAEDSKINAKLDVLNKKYEINHTVIKLEDDTLKRLSDIASEALFTLERQRRYLEDQEGRIQAGIEIEQTMSQLSEEIDKKRYYSGLLTFLQKANQYAVTVDKMLRSIPDGGTTLEHSIAVGKVLSKAKTLRDGYYTIVSALSSSGKLLIDENVTNQDLETLIQQASAIKEIMDGHEGLMKELRKDTMLDLAQEILGSDSVNGLPIAHLINMAEADSSIMDYLYSCERVSDPIVSVMGTVIRDAQLARDKRLKAFAERIRNANAELAKSNQDSKFMYEAITQKRIDWRGFNEAKREEKKRLKKLGLSGTDLSNALNVWIVDNTEEVNGERLPNDSWKEDATVYYIKSNHDYASFNNARRQKERELKRSGITGFAFQDEMLKWEDENMVDEVVDTSSGRTEKVPNSSYDKPLLFDNDDQLKYYNTMMQIKGEIGTLLPSYAQRHYLPPQRRASWIDIVSEGKERELSAKDIASNLLDRMNPLSIKQDDTRYLDGAMLFGDEDTVLSRSNYDDTLLRRVPIYYTTMLRDQSDIMMDFSGALQSLASTASNYDSMFEIKDLVENMADFFQERPIADRNADGKKRIDVVKWGNTIVAKALRKKGESTNTMAIVNGFISKHLYNEQLAKGNEGGLYRKGQALLQALINYTSVNQLAPNLKGAVSNYLVGEAQMMIESVGGEYYNAKNYIWAHGHMFGQGARLGTVVDHLNNTTNTLGHLLEERFDPLQELYTELGGKRYMTGFRKLVGGFNVMGMYSAGESLIHLTNMYAVLDHEKVLYNGKKTSLYNVLDREGDADGNQKLIVKQGATMLDGSAITEDYLDEVKNKIRIVNQKTHGSMNSEDKGLIHRNMAGRAVMNFRQWMVEHYSRRYRGRYFDGTTRTWQEGYYNTVYKLAKSYLADWLKLNMDANAKWDQLDNSQKANVKKALAEFAMLGALLGVSVALGDPKDHKGEWGYRFLIYQIRRLILDETAAVPPIPAVTGGFVEQGITLLNSPVASVKTINGILYPITGLGEIDEEYSRGPHQGENKYWVKFKKNTLPFYGQIDQLIRMGDEDYIFNIFDNISYNKGQ